MELHICMRIPCEECNCQVTDIEECTVYFNSLNFKTRLGVYWRKLIARQKQVFTRFFTSVEIKPLKQNSHCDTAKGFKTVLSMPYLVSKKRAIAQFTRSCSNRHSFHKTTCCKNKKEGRVATDHDDWSYGACKETLGLSFIAFNNKLARLNTQRLLLTFLNIARVHQDGTFNHLFISLTTIYCGFFFLINPM